MRIGITSSLNGDTISLNIKYLEFINKLNPQEIKIYNAITQPPLDVDLMIFSGGSDICPILYGEDNKSSSFHIERDIYEFELLKKCMQTKTPAFGICRGFQLMLISLIHHIFPYELKDFTYHQNIIGHTQSNPRGTPHHFIYSFTGEKLFPVNSLHHQGISIPKNLTKKEYPIQILGVSQCEVFNKEPSVLIEHFISPKYKLGGVQWHPEEMGQINLITEFLKTIKE